MDLVSPPPATHWCAWTMVEYVLLHVSRSRLHIYWIVCMQRDPVFVCEPTSATTNNIFLPQPHNILFIITPTGQ